MLNIYLLIGIIIWGYLLTLLKRANLNAFYFLVGSFGLFIIFSLLSNMYFVWLMARTISEVLKVLSNVIPGFSISIPYNLILINLDKITSVQLYITYECSGAIETFTFESLLIFFPVYTRKEKVIIGIAGILWIMIANIVRLLIIILVVNTLGVQYLFIIHSIIGLILFYIVIVILYYYVFTRTQIVRGWAKKF